MCVTTTNFLFRTRNSKNRPRGVQMFDGSMHCRQLVASRNCRMITRLASNKTMRPPYHKYRIYRYYNQWRLFHRRMSTPIAFWHLHLQACKTRIVEAEKRFWRSALIHWLRSNAFYFNLQNFFLSLKSSSSSLRLLPRITVNSILPSIFLSIKCFRRQFVRKM
jgi:hypothetical protein